MKVILICCLIAISLVQFSDATANRNSFNVKDLEAVGRQMYEQGRTLVHHAAKRFMIILPAIFFKLGIAFTLLVLVTLVAVNNGVIGFMLLVVGLSSVLARLQESRRPATIPVQYISPSFPAAHQIWDRSDSNSASSSDHIYSHGKLAYNGYVGQQLNSAAVTTSPELLTNYYSKYIVSKA